MSLLESLRVALRVLVANKLRSALTMLGIIIGVMAVVALISIGQGAQASIVERIQGLGANVVFVIPGQVRQGGVATGASAQSLTLKDAEAIAQVPGVVGVAPEISRAAQITYGSNNTNTRVVGTTPAYRTVRNVTPAQGIFFRDADNAQAMRVAVLGSQVAEDLFGTTPAVGQTIKINNVPFTVIGVLESKGGFGPGGNLDNAVYIPIRTAYRYLGGRSQVGSGYVVGVINVSVASEDLVDAVVNDITALLRLRHNIRGGEDDFRIFTQQDFLETTQQVTDILTIFLGAIAGISLLVGGIGIMNIMLVSVTERTREIGIRKAVGARNRDILLQFLVEAVVLSVLGGIVGALVGIGVARVVDMTGAFTTRVTPQSVALALGFAAAVGIFFGIYPARRAAQLHPIEALRYE